MCLGGEEDQAGRSARADTGDDWGLAAEIQEEGERSVTACVALSDIVFCFMQDVTKSADARKAEQKRWEESVLRPRRT